MIYFKLILVALFWGGTFVATRIAAQSFGPFTGASIRYLIALAVLIPLVMALGAQGRRIQVRQITGFFLLGLTGIFAYNFFFFNGLRRVPASHGALLVALNPAMVMILTAWLHGEKIKTLKMVGILVSLLGVAFVVSRGHLFSLFHSFQPGDAFMLGCPLTWALYTVIGKSVLKQATPLQATAWASVMGCLMLMAFSFSEPWPQQIPGKVWWALLYLGLLGTVLAFVWYYEGVKVLGATKAAIFNNLVPVFAMILSVVLLREELHGYTYLGAFLVISGVILTNRG